MLAKRPIHEGSARSAPVRSAAPWAFVPWHRRLRWRWPMQGDSRRLADALRPDGTVSTGGPNQNRLDGGHVDARRHAVVKQIRIQRPAIRIVLERLPEACADRLHSSALDLPFHGHRADRITHVSPSEHRGAWMTLQQVKARIQRLRRVIAESLQSSSLPELSAIPARLDRKVMSSACRSTASPRSLRREPFRSGRACLRDMRASHAAPAIVIAQHHDGREGSRRVVRLCPSPASGVERRPGWHQWRARRVEVCVRTSPTPDRSA